MANQMVAVDFNKDGSFILCELVGTKGGWATILDDNGIEHKVRTGQIAMADDAPIEELTDEDEERVGGDVFPEGIREHYERTKLTTEDGKSKVLIDCGDQLAYELRGATLQRVAEMASEHVQEPKMSPQAWLDFYTVDRKAAGKNPLNPGMVRMNIGNRIRAALKRKAEEEA